MISLRRKSTSFTRKRTHSIKRIPVPYIRLAINHSRPCSRANNCSTSGTDNTTGKRCGRFARITFSIHGNFWPNTSRYKNKIADKA